MPGHVPPIQVAPGGVLERPGRIEAALDFVRLAGAAPGGDGLHGARRRRRGRARHAAARRSRASTSCASCRSPRWCSTGCAASCSSSALAERELDSAYGGRFRAIVYRNEVDDSEHMALVRGRPRPRRAGAGAGALAVPDRRRPGLATLRLRRAARGRGAHDRRAGPRRARLPAPGGSRHRAREQDPRLRAAGPGPRHRRGEPRARLQGRPARLRHQRADPARPRRHERPAADQQLAQDRAASPATASRSPSACRSRCRRTTATSATCAPSRRSSATCSPGSREPTDRAGRTPESRDRRQADGVRACGSRSWWRASIAR